MKRETTKSVPVLWALSLLDILNRQPTNRLGASAGSVSFNRTTYYSYATPIAALLPDGRVWITSRKYSVTTSRHTRDLIHALALVGIPHFQALSPSDPVCESLDCGSCA